jgi:tRNA threonylcarbamoyladenosine biosynthesis protein TsaB
MALILHLETATKVCSVALSENGVLINYIESNDDSFSHGEKLTCFIEQLMADERKSMQDLNAISISSGPGSYTGLRIGVSTAKGLCYALKIPLISIDSLYSLVLGAQEKYPNQTICAMIDARRMEVYSLIQKNENVLKSISADVLDEHSYREFTDLILVGDAVSKVKELFQNRNYTFDVEFLSSAKYQTKKSFEMYATNEFVDVAYFEPYYLKDFVAGAKKKS